MKQQNFGLFLFSMLPLFILWPNFSHATTPLRFATDANGIKLSPPSIAYSLQKSGELLVGGKALDLNQKITRLDSCENLCLEVVFHENSKWIVSEPEVVVLDQSNQPQNFKIKKSENTYQVEGSPTGESSQLRVCLAEFQKQEEVILCSGSWDLAQNKILNTQDLKVVINNAPAPNQGSVAVQWLDSFQFLATTSFGSVMIKTQVPQPTLHQAFETEEGDIQVTYYGAESSAVVSKNVDRGAFWQHTIGDLRNYQTDVLKKQDPYIHFESKSKLLFSSQVQYQKLPMASEIVTLSRPHSMTTYLTQVDLPVSLPENYTAQSSADSFNMETSIWTAATPEKYQLNSPALIVSHPEGKSQFTVQPEIYRAHSTFLSARAGISLAADSSIATLGDFSFTHWLEKPFGYSPLLSYQRWGLNSTFVQSATSSNPESIYSLVTGNLIYRFTPGTVDRTETWGATIGVSNLKFAKQPAVNFLGGGVIWSRSLPAWFNRFVGWTEFLRRPKWTDFEIMYHSMSPDSLVTGSIAQVRATARIEVTTATYFDAGWGILTSTYTDKKEQKKGELSISRGYFGFGYRF